MGGGVSSSHYWREDYERLYEDLTKFFLPYLDGRGDCNCYFFLDPPLFVRVKSKEFKMVTIIKTVALIVYNVIIIIRIPFEIISSR